MTPASDSLRRGSATGFLLVTLVATWSCFIVVATRVPFHTPAGRFLVLLGTFAPSIVALAFTARERGRAGLRELLVRALPASGVPVRLYVFALGYTPAVQALVAVLLRLTTGAWPPVDTASWPLVPFAIALSTPVQAGEELGWRGYALPRMAARMGLGRASLVLGLFWGVWHLPLFFVRGASYGQPFPVYLLHVVTLSVVIAWLWARTGGGLFVPMLFHAAVNNMQGLLPTATPGGSHPFRLDASPAAWLTVAVSGVWALFLLVRMARSGHGSGPGAHAADAMDAA
jgi:membrane protease YdiL (CAAX protease family)